VTFLVKEGTPQIRVLLESRSRVKRGEKIGVPNNSDNSDRQTHAEERELQNETVQVRNDAPRCRDQKQSKNFILSSPSEREETATKLSCFASGAEQSKA